MDIVAIFPETDEKATRVALVGRVTQLRIALPIVRMLLEDR